MNYNTTSDSGTSSKITVLFGEEIGSNEQSSIKVEIVANQNEAIEQANKLKLLTLNKYETDDSLFLIFPTNDDYAPRLEEYITGLFNGISDSKMSKDLTKWHNEGNLDYHVINEQNQILLLVRPSEEVLKKMKDTLKQVLSIGADQILLHQKNQILLTIKSMNTFFDIENSMNSGNNFLSSLLQSLLVELNVDLDENFTTKISDILQNAGSAMKNLPIDPSLIPFFKNANMNFKFKSVEDIPKAAREKYFAKIAKNGVSVAPTLPKSDQEQWRELEQLIENGFEMYFTSSTLGAVSFKTNLPGFGPHFLRTINKQDE